MTTAGKTGKTTGSTPTAATTTSWNGFEAAEPAFARGVRERFAAFRHHVLATVRVDGSPRVSGIEATFSAGELWLGGMPGARKSADLIRDQRFALHANPGPGTDMHGGDARVAGRAVLVEDPDVRRRFVEDVDPPLPFDLFRVELTEAVRVRVEGEEIVTEVWRPDGHGLRVLRRGNDDAPARETSTAPAST